MLRYLKQSSLIRTGIGKVTNAGVNFTFNLNQSLLYVDAVENGRKTFWPGRCWFLMAAEKNGWKKIFLFDRSQTINNVFNVSHEIGLVILSSTSDDTAKPSQRRGLKVTAGAGLHTIDQSLPALSGRKRWLWELFSKPLSIWLGDLSILGGSWPVRLIGYWSLLFKQDINCFSRFL